MTVRINHPFEMSQYIARTMKGVMMDRRTTRFLYLVILAGSVLWGGLAVNPAAAAPITYTFAGTVTTINSALSSQFNTTQTMSGQMTVNPGSGSTHSILTFTDFKIGTYQATQLGISGTVTIQNNNTTLNAPSTIDRFALFQSVSGASVNTSYTPSYFSIDLRGPQSLFNSTALSEVPSISSLADMNNTFTVKNEWRLVFSGGKVISGQMSQLTAVPLPAAVVLFGAGLVALVGLGAGSWRPKRSQLVA